MKKQALVFTAVSQSEVACAETTTKYLLEVERHPPHRDECFYSRRMPGGAHQRLLYLTRPAAVKRLCDQTHLQHEQLAERVKSVSLSRAEHANYLDAHAKHRFGCCEWAGLGRTCSKGTMLEKHWALGRMSPHYDARTGQCLLLSLHVYYSLNTLWLIVRLNTSTEGKHINFAHKFQINHILNTMWLSFYQPK